jgi:hypothetical protein
MIGTLSQLFFASPDRDDLTPNSFLSFISFVHFSEE